VTSVDRTERRRPRQVDRGETSWIEAPGPFLYTPAEAAAQLAVPESWLRRKAGRRLIPCTFVGKHLRFSAANLAEIADTGSQPVRLGRRRHRLD
jgi:excisionase family DNA binding protein